MHGYLKIFNQVQIEPIPQTVDEFPLMRTGDLLFSCGLKVHHLNGVDKCTNSIIKIQSLLVACGLKIKSAAQGQPALDDIIFHKTTSFAHG